MFMSQNQNAGLSQNMKINNSSFDRAEEYTLNKSNFYSGRN